MNINIIRAAVVAFVLLVPLSASAVKARPVIDVYSGPPEVPTVIENVEYVTGIPEIDVRKYADYAPVNGWLDVKLGEAIYYKTRIDQKRSKGLESVELFKIPYSEIKELYFGYDAVYKAANDALPTALKTIVDRGGWPVFSARTLPLHMYMKKKNISPVVVFFNRNGTLTSIVFMTNNNNAKSIYLLLAKQSGLKVNEPKTSVESSSPSK